METYMNICEFLDFSTLFFNLKGASQNRGGPGISPLPTSPGLVIWISFNPNRAKTAAASSDEFYKWGLY